MVKPKIFAFVRMKNNDIFFHFIFTDMKILCDLIDSRSAAIFDVLGFSSGVLGTYGVQQNPHSLRFQGRSHLFLN